MLMTRNVIVEDPTENLGCAVCGENHVSELCPLVTMVHHVRDQKIPSRARLTLPTNLSLSVMTDGSTSVIANETILKGTQFGPLEAPSNNEINLSLNFPLKLFDDNGSFTYMDTADENLCNWMSLIRASSALDENNLVAFQLENDIYFTTRRDIEKDEELIVWYAPGYAKRIGIEVVKEDQIIKNENKDFDDKVTVESIVGQLPSNTLGSKKGTSEGEQTEWKCSHCCKNFDSIIDFSRHLQEHYRPLIYEDQNENFSENENPANNEQLSVSDASVRDDAETMHVVISSEVNPIDDGKYNLRKKRRKSRVLREQEDDWNYGTRKKKKLNRKKENIQIVKKQEDFSEENKPKLACDICGSVFTKYLYLYRHIKKHTREFTCVKCCKVFARNENLKTHICTSMIADDVDNSLDYPCVLCSKSFASQTLLERHGVQHKTLQKCSKCKATFANVGILENHECTNNESPYKCEFCKKVFTREIYLKKHLPLHTRKFQCSICNAILRCRQSFNHHTVMCTKMKELKEHGQVLCDACNELFTDEKLFKKHFNDHHDFYVCDNCGARFKSEVNLGLHVCAEIACKICGKKFSRIGKLQRHLFTHQDQIFKCEQCEQPFCDETSLQNHECSGYSLRACKPAKDGDTNKTFICEICGSFFASLSSLNIHRTLHGEKRFCCDTCGKRFHRKDLLRDHESVHAEATIECTVCGKLFKTKKSMDVHLGIHRGVKRFECDVCHKQFFQKGNLHKHYVTHTPGVKHECTICSKSFLRKEYLKLHTLEHTQGKIHTCELCGRGFVKAHQLRNHRRMSHGNQGYICKYCGLTVKLRHSLKRHLEKKHSYAKKEWDKDEIITSMAVNGDNEIIEAGVGLSFDSKTLEIVEDNEVSQGAKVLLAVAGLGTEALEHAIAEGKAHVRQGLDPNTIEISLPFGIEGDELTRAIVQESSEIRQENVIIEESVATSDCHTFSSLDKDNCENRLHSDCIENDELENNELVINTVMVDNGKDGPSNDSCVAEQDDKEVMINIVDNGEQLVVVNDIHQELQSNELNGTEECEEQIQKEDTGEQDGQPVLFYFVADNFESET